MHMSSYDAQMYLQNRINGIMSKSKKKLSHNFLPKPRLKQIIIDNHYRTIYGSVRILWTSDKVS